VYAAVGGPILVILAVALVFWIWRRRSGGSEQLVGSAVAEMSATAAFTTTDSFLSQVNVLSAGVDGHDIFWTNADEGGLF
jgi:uncharacterized secreted protein with C-terminal beta-propeller domain